MDFLDTNLLIDGLKWLIAGGGAMVAVYALMEAIPYLANLGAEVKRYVSYGLGATIGAGSTALLVWLKAITTPSTPQEWVLLLAAGALLACGGSQLIHGYRKLKYR
ncbi:MAG: hypothetical protein ACYSYL_00030 [Planctomycetota bacterium]